MYVRWGACEFENECMHLMWSCVCESHMIYETAFCRIHVFVRQNKTHITYTTWQAVVSVHRFIVISVFDSSLTYCCMRCCFSQALLQRSIWHCPHCTWSDRSNLIILIAFYRQRLNGPSTSFIDFLSWIYLSMYFTFVCWLFTAFRYWSLLISFLHTS